MELIKNILFYIALGAGSICLISLFIAAAIKCICIMLDHLKVANVLREAIVLYINTKRPDLSLKENDIDLSKERAKIK